jgi:3-(3-hydroxy-phenyl)propionate hydroxylase
MLLAGDAAHLNNPLGGFGLNSALQDAINLTDKLVAVWRAEADDSLLDRYVRQRRTANVEYVQESSIRNKRTLEEVDPPSASKGSTSCDAPPKFLLSPKKWS